MISLKKLGLTEELKMYAAVSAKQNYYKTMDVSFPLVR